MGFKFEINQSKKAVIVTVEGFFTAPEAEAYLKEFQATLKKVTPANFSLIVDGRKQAVVPQSIKEELQQAVDFYLSAGFKQVYIVELESAIGNMQVKRLKGIDKIILVKRPEDALVSIH